MTDKQKNLKQAYPCEPCPHPQETKQPKAQVSPDLTDKVIQGGDNEGAAQKGKTKYICMHILEWIYTYM